MERDTDVLVVGAGPTGLVLALWLARAGVRVRVIDQTPEPGTTSRAIGVAARTLELYRQLGLADEVVAAGWRVPAVDLWVRARRVARIELGAIGAGLSPFPFELMYPQDEHERLLIARLADLGVPVERPRALVGFDEDEGSVIARLDDGTTCRAAYLAGCDGARSTVRHALAIDFPGGTYSQVFYVADIEARGPVMNGELHVSLDTSDFLAVFPLAGPGHARLIGTVRAEAGDEPRWDDVSPNALKRLSIDVTRVHWFSTYRVHHRVASRFRAGRAFLLGDAAHIHSPVGAQGMNTGIGDAVNLAWKLAAALRSAPAALLDSYELERRGFARQLVATTDRAFQVANRSGRLAQLVRTRVAPLVIRAVSGGAMGRRAVFRTLSQIGIAYPESPLSDGAAGEVRAGDRLPWVPAATGADDNFAPLVSRAWQLHVYGDARPELHTAGVPVHVVPWSEAARDAGLARDAAYLVRPDGYVGWARADARVDDLERYVTTWCGDLGR